jgi:hypothetical protein
MSKFAIHNTYSLIIVWDEDVLKTAIHIQYGLFEFLVIPIRLTNAPIMFNGNLNIGLRTYLNVFYTIYLDNILIYNSTLKEHIQHICQILGHFQQAGLQVKPQKYEFHKTTIKYHEMLVILKGRRMDLGKVSAVDYWPAPQQLHNICTFIRFDNYY